MATKSRNNSQRSESSSSMSTHMFKPAVAIPLTESAQTGFYLNDDVIKQAIKRVRDVRKNLVNVSKIKN